MVEARNISLKNIKYILCCFFFLTILTLCLLFPISSYAGGVGLGIEGVDSGQQSFSENYIIIIDGGAIESSIIEEIIKKSLINTNDKSDEIYTTPRISTKIPNHGNMIIQDFSGEIKIEVTQNFKETTKTKHSGVVDSVGDSGSARSIGAINGSVNQLSHKPVMVVSSAANLYDRSVSIATLLDTNF